MANVNRRRFLRWASAGAAALAISEKVSKTDEVRELMSKAGLKK